MTIGKNCGRRLVVRNRKSVSDPHLDDSNNMEDGVLISRRLLCDIADPGVPSATEFLDPEPEHIDL